MQIIQQGLQNILKLLSVKEDADCIYLPSRFLLRYETEDGTLLHNTLTGELVLLSSEERELFDHLPLMGGEKALDDLIRHRFIVPSSCREKQTVEQLITVFLKRRESENVITRYVILPTTGCNAHCFYCYESDMLHVGMSEETADLLSRFIADHHNGNRVILSWFGGEPTLGRNRIDQICRRLKEFQIEYVSDMVSNGYLFDEQLVKWAKTEWNLKRIQITLDGTEEIYNKTKAYSNVTDNPYERVLKNISLFLREDIHVDIRLNFAEHNAQDMKDLIRELSDKFGGSKQLIVYVRQLREDVGYSPIRHHQCDDAELTQQYKELLDLLESHGWPQFLQTTLPSLATCCCMADDPFSIQCAPDGILGKCEDQIFEHSIGTLRKGIIDKAEIMWWRERDFFDKCEKCPLLPSCRQTLKHCPAHIGGCSAYEKDIRINICYKLIAERYDRWKTDNLK